MSCKSNKQVLFHWKYFKSMVIEAGLTIEDVNQNAVPVILLCLEHKFSFLWVGKTHTFCKQVWYLEQQTQTFQWQLLFG